MYTIVHSLINTSYSRRGPSKGPQDYAARDFASLEEALLFARSVLRRWRRAGSLRRGFVWLSSSSGARRVCLFAGPSGRVSSAFRLFLASVV